MLRHSAQALLRLRLAAAAEHAAWPGRHSLRQLVPEACVAPSGRAFCKGAAQDAEAAEAAGAAADAGSDGEASTSADVKELQAELQASATKLEEAEKQNAVLKENVLRSLADMENLRARTAKQIDDARQFALQGFAKELLEIADNLDRALDNVPQDVLEGAAAEEPSVSPQALAANLKSLHGGVSMSRRIMLKVFAKNGVEPVECEVGSEFDPNVHNAMFEVPTGDVEAGKVAAIVKRGFTLHGRVIRATDVGIAQPPAS